MDGKAGQEASTRRGATELEAMTAAAARLREWHGGRFFDAPGQESCAADEAVED